MRVDSNNLGLIFIELILGNLDLHLEAAVDFGDFGDGTIQCEIVLKE